MLPIHHARERAIVATVVLDVVRALGAGYPHTARFGNRATNSAPLLRAAKEAQKQIRRASATVAIT